MGRRTPGPHPPAVERGLKDLLACLEVRDAAGAARALALAQRAAAEGLPAWRGVSAATVERLAKRLGAGVVLAALAPLVADGHGALLDPRIRGAFEDPRVAAAAAAAFVAAERAAATAAAWPTTAGGGGGLLHLPPSSSVGGAMIGREYFDLLQTTAEWLLAASLGQLHGIFGGGGPDGGGMAGPELHAALPRLHAAAEAAPGLAAALLRRAEAAAAAAPGAPHALRGALLPAWGASAATLLGAVCAGAGAGAAPLAERVAGEVESEAASLARLLAAAAGGGGGGGGAFGPGPAGKREVEALVRAADFATSRRPGGAVAGALLASPPALAALAWCALQHVEKDWSWAPAGSNAFWLLAELFQTDPTRAAAAACRRAPGGGGGGGAASLAGALLRLAAACAPPVTTAFTETDACREWAAGQAWLTQEAVMRLSHASEWAAAWLASATQVDPVALAARVAEAPAAPGLLLRMLRFTIDDRGTVIAATAACEVLRAACQVARQGRMPMPPGWPDDARAAAAARRFVARLIAIGGGPRLEQCLNELRQCLNNLRMDLHPEPYGRLRCSAAEAALLLAHAGPDGGGSAGAPPEEDPAARALSEAGFEACLWWCRNPAFDEPGDPRCGWAALARAVAWVGPGIMPGLVSQRALLADIAGMALDAGARPAPAALALSVLERAAEWAAVEREGGGGGGSGGGDSGACGGPPRREGLGRSDDGGWGSGGSSGGGRGASGGRGSSEGDGDGDGGVAWAAPADGSAGPVRRVEAALRLLLRCGGGPAVEFEAEAALDVVRTHLKGFLAARALPPDPAAAAAAAEAAAAARAPRELLPPRVPPPYANLRAAAAAAAAAAGGAAPPRGPARGAQGRLLAQIAKWDNSEGLAAAEDAAPDGSGPGPVAPGARQSAGRRSGGGGGGGWTKQQQQQQGLPPRPARRRRGAWLFF
ncbi:hypothetical protein Rsub_12287 [Raphidocelis subcapitata]|uniref:Uncharacterized protein n=1 Tax=Raphidocelis subcapitata TaxID=307507 RepID=A0A2V0PIX4_9CHLO|nr:hypothetical protein Rsub_12287 [Raphidocelis subcapitata]|eukprot:GBF99509.1 hypothetical protein Rsub_12287 [Raphidocelis subcapitata]